VFSNQHAGFWILHIKCVLRGNQEALAIDMKELPDGQEMLAAGPKVGFATPMMPL